MEGLSLLERARQAGLDVRVEGNTLVVTGPKRLGDLAQALLAAKTDVLAELRCEARLDAAIREAVPIFPETFRIRTVEDLLALWEAGSPPAECRACRASRWWRLAGRVSVARPWICGACHPPLVAPERIEWSDGGRP